MAYSMYVAAAVVAGAAFPEFLREHLFDGLAPAALVGYLVSKLPFTKPREAFPRISFADNYSNPIRDRRHLDLLD